ncbi:hypothetical protein RRG08_002354 [Elysia crispata]|uniref:Uncharacterized protein n=1 Tax=Elysia crispata TaxID=231223 RepID=A0AAE0ZRJ3_9GAST|nr:hypothetical protein RRG08_002354 [Elysia crispata]
MESQNKDKANEIFENVVDFLTQPFPDFKKLTADSADDVLNLMLKQEVSKVSKKLNSVNTELESFREQTAIRLNKTVPDVVARATSNTAMTATSLRASGSLHGHSISLWLEISVPLTRQLCDHLHSLKLSSSPDRITLIDSGPGNTWKVAVTLPRDHIIAVLEVTQDSVTQLAITAVDSATLAVGYDGGP